MLLDLYGAADVKCMLMYKLAVAKMKIDLVAVAKLVLLYKLAVARFI
jgi:hypothetical protein